MVRYVMGLLGGSTLTVLAIGANGGTIPQLPGDLMVLGCFGILCGAIAAAL